MTEQAAKFNGGQQLYVPMSMQQTPIPPFPQSGWHKLEEWAFAIGEEVRTFRRKLDSANIPYAQWGNQIFVHADRVAAYLSSIERCRNG